MIDVYTALKQTLQNLENPNDNSRLEAEILLSHVLNKNRAYLYSHPKQLLSQTQFKIYEHLINQRIQGMPIAYLTGHREFWSLSLKVNQTTLIPRHETERLVELTLELLMNQSNSCILDLGTGCGSIALALAKERPDWQIDACDCSEMALNVARDNAMSHGITNVNFYQSDWFRTLPPKHYHAIVSNPPYLAEGDPHLKQGDLRFEPQSALVSGQDGLADLHYIIKHSKDYLLPDGLLLLEHGCYQKVSIMSILNQLRYQNVQCWQDIQEHDRVSGGWCPIN